MRQLGLLLLMFSKAALAQNPASVNVTADASKVVAGGSIRAVAVVRDPSGAVMDRVSVRWSVNNANLASVDPEGNVTGKGLGIVRVRGTAPNNVFGETSIQIVPARVVLDPPVAELTVGQSRKFTAQFLDNAGNPIAGATPRWSVLTGVGFNSNAARVDAQGMVQAIAEGDLTVRAFFSYGTYIPSFFQEVDAQARLVVRPPRHFDLRREVATLAPALPAARRLTFRATYVAGNDAGDLLMLSSLDGLTTGLAHSSGGRYRMLAAVGEPGPVANTVTADFFNFSINGAGQILTGGSMNGSANNIWFGDTASGIFPRIWENTPMAGFEALNGLRPSRSSLAEDGSFVFYSSSFREPGATATLAGLFFVDATGEGRSVATNLEEWPELGGRPSFDTDAFGAGPDEAVWFTAFNGTRRAVYRQQRFDRPVKILAVGDTVQGVAVRSFLSSAMFLAGRDGSVVFGVQLADNRNMLLHVPPSGRVSDARALVLSGWSATWTVHPEHGVLFQGSEPGRRNGVLLWNGSETRRIVETNTDSAAGAPVQQIDGAAIDRSGAVTAIVRTAESVQMFVRFGPEPGVLYRLGDTVEASGPLSALSFLPGARTQPHLLAGGGFGSSIHTIAPGRIEPVWIAGERVNGTQLFNGSSRGNSIVGGDGEVYITNTSGFGLARRRNGTIERVIPATRALDGTNLNAPSEVRVNASGAILTTQTTNNRGTCLALTIGTTVQLPLCNNGSTVLDGFGPVTSWGDQQLDDRGRIAAILRTANNVTGIGVWEAGNWRLLWQTGGSIAGRALSGADSVRAGGATFIFRALFPGGSRGVYRYADGAPELAVDPEEAAANGIIVNSLGIIDANARGDIFFQSFAFGQTTYGVRLATGGYRHIYANNAATAEGDLLWRLIDVSYLADGTVWMMFVDVSDQIVIYRATPR